MNHTLLCSGRQGGEAFTIRLSSCRFREKKVRLRGSPSVRPLMAYGIGPVVAGPYGQLTAGGRERQKEEEGGQDNERAGRQDSRPTVQSYLISSHPIAFHARCAKLVSRVASYLRKPIPLPPR